MLKDYSGIHDGYCRCRSCKPPLPAIDSNKQLLVDIIKYGCAFIVGFFAIAIYILNQGS